LRAAEHERPEVQRQRATVQDTVKPLAPDDLVFLDAAGSPQVMTRLYARAPRGQRALATQPVNRGYHGPRLGALSLQGLVAAMTVEGFTEGTVFLAFLHAGLRPQLRPGPMRFLENLTAHKVAGGAAACAAAGVRLLSLPPYAPDFSPIAECWSKVKACWRAKAARTREALEQAIAEACAAITSQDAHGWCTHAGYCVVSN
jgi:transposase